MVQQPLDLPVWYIREQVRALTTPLIQLSANILGTQQTEARVLVPQHAYHRPAQNTCTPGFAWPSHLGQQTPNERPLLSLS